MPVTPKLKSFNRHRVTRVPVSNAGSHTHLSSNPTPPSRRINRALSSKSIRCEMSVIPVGLDQTPGQVHFSSGCSVDAAGETFSVMVDRDESFSTRTLVIGAYINGPVPAFATATILNQWRMDGQLRIEIAMVNDAANALFSPGQLLPRIDPVCLRFHYGLPGDILDQWESLGVLRPYLIDRILVCPDCISIPTWRNACAKCGSARFETTKLIHHFACAHVGPVESFECERGVLHCPKCRAVDLVAGTDFQYASGPVNCLDCHEGGCQPVLHCMCHRCMQRFEPAAALEQEIYGYDLERLELLDLVAASQ
ncbi:MAG: hypothetical protein WBD20_23105 [Pirellulaceae bacterium]